ncbi:hypothetical protein TIFTF001_013220 [Ficus carica]|uniref:TRF2/HOY1 PH-like domain-containing protein n=1 Tax=Ficus carica TaxID=3494 RepID=A0AA87ZXC0_FICCA|nr:hypothetical protein TIFTF001_013220 [Ficus carica]
METHVDSMNQENLVEVLKTLPPLGLKLHAASFKDFIQDKSNHKKRSKLANEIRHSKIDFSAENLLEQEALKASKISAFLLKIGSWERAAKNEEDVVAKFYFAKRRLLWEILENGLKKKIEIRWEQVLSMRVVIEDYQPGILEVELWQPPMFFLETEPEPRKHSRWKNIADFTDGQATICRRHFLKFPPNALNKHWEKLLQFEPRFLRMCQSPFSVLQDPYFRSDLDYEGENISFNCNGNGTEMNSLLQSPYSKDFNAAGPTATFGYNGDEPQLNSLQQLPCSSDLMSLSHIHGHQNQVYPTICTKPSFHFDDFSPTSVMDISNQPIDELIPYNEVERRQSMRFWEQQPNNYADIAEGDTMIQGQFSTAFPIPSHDSPVISHRNNNLLSDNNEKGLHNPHCLMPVYDGNRLPNYSYTEDLNAIAALLDSTGYGHQRVVNENSGGQFHSQTMSWRAPEDNAVYADFGPDQAWKDFAGNQNWIDPWI